MDTMGIKMYEMEYEATYSVAKLPCYGKFSSNGNSFDIGDSPSDKPNQIKVFSKEAQNELPLGKTFSPSKKKLTFVKKENGWEGEVNGLMGIF